MIKKSASIKSDFYFKREDDLDSEGNSVYVLLPKEGQDKEPLTNENLLYIHLPQDKNIDELNFLIEDKNNINTSYMDFETPINLYLRETEAHTILIDLGAKMAMDKDLKLYIEGVAQFHSNQNHYNIGFHDDPRLPVFGNNKVFIKDLVIENVNNSNLLFRRDKYNSEKYMMKSLVWGNDNDMNYCIAAEYAFIKIHKNQTIYRDASILSDGVKVLFGNLSGKKSKTLSFSESILDCGTNGNDIVEFSAPAVLLYGCNIIVVNNEEGETALNRIIRDSSSITFSYSDINVTGMLEATSESGLFSTQKGYDRVVLENSSITTIKADKGSIFLENKAVFENAHIKSEGSVYIEESTIKDSIIKNSSNETFSIIKSYINNSTIEESKFESGKAIYRAHIDNFQLIRPTFNYINNDLQEGANLYLISDLSFSRPIVEDCSFTLSEFSKTSLNFLSSSDFGGGFFSEGLDGADSNNKNIKGCAFYGENVITIKKACDFNNNVFKDTNTVVSAGNRVNNIKNSIYNSEFFGKNYLADMPEPISNAVFNNVRAINVKGLSNSFVKDYTGEHKTFVFSDPEAVDTTSVSNQSLEVL
jgi:hypothetical protein